MLNTFTGTRKLKDATVTETIFAGTRNIKSAICVRILRTAIADITTQLDDTRRLLACFRRRRLLRMLLVFTSNVDAAVVIRIRTRRNRRRGSCRTTAFVVIESFKELLHGRHLRFRLRGRTFKLKLSSQHK
jgi:hypothetical protein